MFIFDGVYSWDGKRYFDEENISWWPCSYNLQIIDVSQDMPGALLMKPLLSVFSNTGEGGTITNCTQNFIMRICSDFKIDSDKVMWIEHFPRYNDSFELITVTRRSLGTREIMGVRRREPLPNELAHILKYYRRKE